MRVTYDDDSGYGYLYIVDEIAEGESVRQEVVYVGIDEDCGCKSRLIIDLDKDNKILGIEFEDAEILLRQETLGLPADLA